MRKHTWWTLKDRATGELVLPMDCNPESDDKGFLVYRTKEAAQAACNHQRSLYDLDPIPIRLDEILL